MTQGPDNQRPEPYISDGQPGGSRPGPDARGDADRFAGGPRPDPQAASAPAGAYPAEGARTGQAGSAGPATGTTQPAEGGPAGPVGQAADPAVVEALKAELAEAQARAAALQDQYLRALADGENLRRRTQEEIAKARKFAIESFAESLLPVIDSLELALKVDSPSMESLREGVEATLRLMVSAFEKHQLVGIDPAGQKFDPNHHQAISTVPADATNPPIPANHVAAVLQKGYLINDRVLRPALVTVVQG